MKMKADQILSQAQDTITVKRVFGEPYEKNGVTVITAAGVLGGGGAGSGEAPGDQGEVVISVPAAEGLNGELRAAHVWLQLLQRQRPVSSRHLSNLLEVIRKAGCRSAGRRSRHQRTSRRSTHPS